MYRSDIRLVIKKEGFNILKELCNVAQDKMLKNLIKEENIKNQVADIVYLGWDRLNSNKVDFIRKSLFDIEEKDISYRIAVINEKYADVEIYGYRSEKDKEKNIPTPYIERVFNEEKIRKEFEDYAKAFNEKDEVEEIEYE